MVPAAAVGAAGVPVKVGPANAAFASNAACNPFVLAIVKLASVIVACFASNADCNPVVLDIVKLSSKPSSASQSPVVPPTKISSIKAFPTPFPPTSNVLAYASQ